MLRRKRAAAESCAAAAPVRAAVPVPALPASWQQSARRQRCAPSTTTRALVLHAVVSVLRNNRWPRAHGAGWGRERVLRTAAGKTFFPRRIFPKLYICTRPGNWYSAGQSELNGFAKDEREHRLLHSILACMYANNRQMSDRGSDAWSSLGVGRKCPRSQVFHYLPRCEFTSQLCAA